MTLLPESLLQLFSFSELLEVSFRQPRQERSLQNVRLGSNILLNCHFRAPAQTEGGVSLCHNLFPHFKIYLQIFLLLREVRGDEGASSSR